MLNKWGKWGWIALLVAVFIVLGALWNSGFIQDATASYVSFSGAGEVANSVYPGDRVSVPLTVSSTGSVYDDYQMETAQNGLIVRAPSGGFVKGTHRYYLQIATTLVQPGLHARPGDADYQKKFLVAVVKRIE